MDVVISGDDALCIGAELTRRRHRVHRMPSDQEAAAETLARVTTHTGVLADAVVHLAQL
jgi:hypothetical protein